MATKLLNQAGVNYTPYYQQETNDFSGAAVMRMVLGSAKIGLNPLPNQLTLYNQAHGRNDASEPVVANWKIDPQGMRDALMALRPSTFTGTFVMNAYTLENRAAANSLLVQTINTYQVAPAVLIEQGKKWLAVVGYTTNDSTGGIQSIYVHDPRPAISEGTGDEPFHAIDIDSWNMLENYFSPVVGGTRWNNQLVIVRDPDPLKEQLALDIQRRRGDGSQLIGPERILELVQERARERGLLQIEATAQALLRGRPTRPQLVQVADAEEKLYYLIRYQLNGLDAAIVAIDARYGFLLEWMSLPKPKALVTVEPEEAVDLVVRSERAEQSLTATRDRILDQVRQDLEHQQRQGLRELSADRLTTMLDRELAAIRRSLHPQALRSATMSVHPVMSWRSTPDNYSLLFPYYVVNTPDQQLYVSALDGQIINKTLDLTPRMGG
jgi:hypothetical protein